MKRYLLTICDTQGEYEHRTKVLISSRNMTTANAHAKRIQRTWYDDDGGTVENDYVTFNCGEVATSIEDLKEIPEVDFLVLKNYIHEM